MPIRQTMVKTANENEDVHDAIPSSVYSVVSWLTVSGSGSEEELSAS